MLDLKTERLRNNLSQERLAELAGVTRTAITNLESGYSKPSVALAQKLGQILGVEWSKFFE